jgi:tetratricopeptide (TPR) repeat protein
MFRWYREATQCYVYLSDVPDPKNPATAVESAFPTSRWFKRGWTLQELIAPLSVQFFSRTGELLGSKKSREQQIYEITGVALEALRGQPLSQFDIEERLSWAATRDTKVEEDAAYCLLGIFDIHMPLIYGEGQQNALNRLRRKIQKSSNLVLLGAKHGPWIVPFERNPRFTGRESQLTQLEEKLFTKDYTTKIAITGLGGVGKTQLILELLYRTRDKHKQCSIIWIPANDEGSLQQAYLDVARQLKIPGWDDEKVDVKNLVQKFLSNDDAGQWLVVFDNADDIEMWISQPGSRQVSEQESNQGSRCLIDYLPRSEQGCIIFTTRDIKTANKLAKQNVVKVLQMDEEAATQLLQKWLHNPDLVESRQNRAALLTELTYLPLAIVQAAAYINENEIPLSEYMMLLNEQEENVIELFSEEFEDDWRYRNLKNPVATTWLISFEQIQRRNPLAADYLSFMSCLDPKDIPQSLRPPGPSLKKETEAIGTLIAYAFITRRPAHHTFDVHRLVHLSTRNWLRKEKLFVQWSERAVTQLEKVLQGHEDSNRHIWKTHLPHALHVLQSSAVCEDYRKRIDLAWKVGKYLYNDGRYNEASVSLKQVMEFRKSELGLDHPDTLTSMYRLALTFGYQGLWEEAEELGIQVIERRKKVLGDDHPDTLAAMVRMVLLHTIQGQWQKAEALGAQTVKDCVKVLGQEHEDTLTIMNNLALTYRDQGRWKEAEELIVQVKETSKRVLGPEHDFTLVVMGNLVATYKDQSRWDEAEELEIQVVETSKRVLGMDHPHTLAIMNNRAMTFRYQSRWKEAEELIVQVMETSKRVLGPEHPFTLTVMNNLAMTYRRQSRWKEAEELTTQVTVASTGVHGMEYPSTLTIMGILAVTSWSRTQRDQGEDSFVQVVGISKRILDEGVDDTPTRPAKKRAM